MMALYVLLTYTTLLVLLAVVVDRYNQRTPLGRLKSRYVAVPLYALLMASTASGTPIDRAQRIQNICRERKFRCELRCNNDTRGATTGRIRCYERCAEDESFCRKDGYP